MLILYQGGKRLRWIRSSLQKSWFLVSRQSLVTVRLSPTCNWFAKLLSRGLRLISNVSQSRVLTLSLQVPVSEGTTIRSRFFGNLRRAKRKLQWFEIYLGFEKAWTHDVFKLKANNQPRHCLFILCKEDEQIEFVKLHVGSSFLPVVYSYALITAAVGFLFRKFLYRHLNYTHGTHMEIACVQGSGDDIASHCVPCIRLNRQYRQPEHLNAVPPNCTSLGR